MIVFSITNEFTGCRVDVLCHGEDCFVVELTDVDSHEYVGQRTFETQSAAINHAVLLS